MLALTRSIGQSIMIGDNIELYVTSINKNNQVTFGINAPDEVKIWRKELYNRINADKETSGGN